MSVLVPVTINGQTSINGVPLLAQAEYTSGPIVAQYQDAMQVFTEIFNLPSASAAAAITSGNYASRIQNSIAELNNIAANGVPDPADVGSFPTPIQPRRLTVQMVSAMDSLYRTLNIAGIPTDGTSVSVQQVLNWRNISFSSSEVQSIISLADAASGAQNKTLQALTELVYVETGNQILSQSLGSLQTALSTTSTVLTTLNDLQQLHNQITAVDKQSFAAYVSAATGISNRLDTRVPPNKETYQPVAGGGFFKWHQLAFGDRFGGSNSPYLPGGINVGHGPTQYTHILPRGDPSLFGFQIPSLASAHFGVLTPQISSALANSINPYIIQFLNLRQKMAVQITALSSITSDLKDTQTLYARLKVVYSGMNKAIAINNGYMPSALKMWILDNQSAGVMVSAGSPNAAAINALITAKNNLGASGDLQTGINNAITAGQNLNDTQKETTRRYLFVFEEYYKSASAILTKLSDIITKMAQGIAR